MQHARTKAAVLTATAALTGSILLTPATAAPLPATAAPLPATAAGSSAAVALPVMSGRGLPYTLWVDYLSGGGEGVRTPDLAANSGGRICLDPNLYESKRPDGNVPSDYGYFARLWQNKARARDTRIGGTLSFNTGSDPKKCWTGVPKNVTVYVKVQKSKFLSGQLLAGDGRVTYS